MYTYTYTHTHITHGYCPKVGICSISWPFEKGTIIGRQTMPWPKCCLETNPEEWLVSSYFKTLSHQSFHIFCLRVHWGEQVQNKCYVSDPSGPSGENSNRD